MSRTWLLLLAAVTGAVVLGTFGPSAPSEARPPQVRAVRDTASAPDLTSLIADTQARLRTHPADSASWGLLGSEYVEQARRTADPTYYPRAQQALGRSLRLTPADNDGAVVGMGALANARHDFARARDWGARARRAEPDDWSVYGVLADAYTQLGDADAATGAVQRMLDLRPGVASFTRASYEFEQHGRVADAEMALRRALDDAVSPADQAYCLERLGELAWNDGNPGAALTDFDAALRADPTHYPALDGRARAEASLGRTAEAVRDYERVTAWVPLPQYVLEFGELRQALGEHADAKRQYALLGAEQRLFAANGVIDDLTIGQYEADHGDPRSAVRHLEAEWGRRHNVLVADALGWALHRAGHDTRALSYAESAARLGWRNATFAFHRGEIERSLGRHREARRDLRRALAINPHFSPLYARVAKADL